MTSIIKVDQIEKTDGSSFDFGKVLQVVQATDTTQIYTTTTGSDIEFFSASITPTLASSKVLVTFTAFISANPNGGFWLKRDTTKLGGTGGSSGNYNHPDNFFNTDDFSWVTHHIGPVAYSYLDSPSTSTSTTYSFGFRSASTSAQVGFNRRQSGTDSKTRSVMTLTEIAG